MALGFDSNFGMGFRLAGYSIFKSCNLIKARVVDFDIFSPGKIIYKYRNKVFFFFFFFFYFYLRAGPKWWIVLRSSYFDMVKRIISSSCLTLEYIQIRQNREMYFSQIAQKLMDFEEKKRKFEIPHTKCIKCKSGEERGKRI